MFNIECLTFLIFALYINEPIGTNRYNGSGKKVTPNDIGYRLVLRLENFSAGLFDEAVEDH